MEEKKIVVDNVVSVAGLTLIPVARISKNLWSTRVGETFLASKQPIAVIVISPQSKRAFRITGEEVSLQELIREVPNLKEML